jgi:RNA polymerase sigma-70 factor (ECF subfamily)
MDASRHEPLPSVEAAWHRHRRRVLDVAYRMLGSLSDANDIVSEAYARLVAHGIDGIDDPAGWLITVTSRLCLDRLRSAEVTRRAYVGPWLPEPILGVAGGGVDPADRVTLDDSVRMALLIVLEQLSPAERTVFVLADVFGVGFDEVATMVGRSPAACRQLAVRARARLADTGAVRFRPDPSEQRRVVEQFARACAEGDLGGLVAVLHDDVSGEFDSGGFIPGAPLDPAFGRDPVGRLLHYAFAGRGASFTVESVNGEPGVVVGLAGRIAAVIALEVRDGRVSHVHGIGNPAKLEQPRARSPLHAGPITSSYSSPRSSELAAPRNSTSPWSDTDRDRTTGEQANDNAHDRHP